MLNTIELIEMLGGYGISEVDNALLIHSLNYAKMKILNEIAHEEVPIELHEFWKRLAIVEYLIAQQGLNKLSDNITDESTIVKSISEGDTKVEYEKAITKQDRLDVFIKYLHNSIDWKELYSFRKLRW